MKKIPVLLLLFAVLAIIPAVHAQGSSENTTPCVPAGPNEWQNPLPEYHGACRLYTPHFPVGDNWESSVLLTGNVKLGPMVFFDLRDENGKRAVANVQIPLVDYLIITYGFQANARGDPLFTQENIFTAVPGQPPVNGWGIIDVAVLGPTGTPMFLTTVPVTIQIGFRHRNATGNIDNRASVPAMVAQESFSLTCQRYTSGKRSRSDCGIALANPQSIPATVTATVRNINGSLIGTFTVSLSPTGHVAKMLGDFFAFPSGFSDVECVIDFSSPGVTILGMGLKNDINPDGSFVISGITVGPGRPVPLQ